MKFKELLQKLIDGLTSYYRSYTDLEKREKPEYQYFLKMGECEDIDDLIKSMDDQGFGYPNEPLAWWILTFIVQEEG